MKENTPGHRTSITIPVTRDGKEERLPLPLCATEEITGYFSSLSREDLISWVSYLAGYACGADFEIERLKKREVDFTRGG